MKIYKKSKKYAIYLWARTTLAHRYLSIRLNTREYFLGYFLCVFLLYPLNIVEAHNLYVKVDTPLYKVVGSDKIRTNYSFAVGYQLSDYFDSEINIGSYNYSFEGIKKTYGGQIDPNSHDIFTRAYIYDWGQTHCTNIRSTFETKSTICRLGTAQTTSTSVSSKLYTVIPSLRFKPLKKKGRFTPYVSAGVGIAHTKTKISTPYINEGNIENQHLQKRTRALALEFGLGTKIQIIRRVNLDLEIKYFNYGNHKFVPGYSKKITGYRIGTAVSFIL